MNITNSASGASVGLGTSIAELGKSLTKFASGSKLGSSSDDAGGLAVAMKLDAAISRTRAVQSNIASATSYLQTQDGALSVAGNVLDRMSQLAILSKDPTKSSADKANYQTEFSQLQDQLQSLSSETFNGVALFGSAGGSNTLDVATSEDGTQAAQIDKALLDNPSGEFVNVKNSANSLTDGSVDVSMIKKAMEEVASLRAQNGASASRLQFADSTLKVGEQNLISAYSRIADVDVAQESTNFAKVNMLAHAGVGMLAQANLLGRTVLKLIG